MTESLRPLEMSDAERILDWRNAPQVRNQSFTRSIIGMEDHLNWLRRTLDDDTCAYFVYEASYVPLGVVGLTGIDHDASQCYWSFYASPDAPRGTGTRMLTMALEHAFGRLGLRKVHSEVLAGNDASIRLHEKLGFQLAWRGRTEKVTDGMPDVLLFTKPNPETDTGI